MPDPPPALTSGSIIRPLIRLAVPFAVGNVFSLVTMIVDRLWVGQVGTEALAALGTAHAALMVLITLLMGMAIGTLSGVAMAIGRNDPEEAIRYFGQGMLIGTGLGVVVGATGFFAPDAVMRFMGAESEVAAPAAEYLRISMWGMAVQGPLFMVTFALQGAGEARAALKLSVVAPVINAVLDPVFIFTLEMGMPGAAWATVVANAVALAAGWVIVGAGGSRLRPTSGWLRPRRLVARRIVAIGVPGSLEHVVRTTASFSLVTLLTDFGATVLSAYTTAMVLVMALVLPGLALGQATASLMGQNLGAGEPVRAWRTAWVATGLYTAFMAVVGTVIWFCAAPIVRVFDANPAVIEEGVRLLRVLVYCLPSVGVALSLSKAFSGAGSTMPAMVAAATAHLAYQIPAVWWLGARFGPTGAYWGMSTAFMVHGALSAWLFVRRFRPAAPPLPEPSLPRGAE